MMKAITYREFGSTDCLAVEEVEKPTPGDGQVLVAVRAAAVNVLDWYFLRGGLVTRLLLGRKPKRIGRDVAGVVEAVGRNVSRLKPGDEVFGIAAGTFAEYVCASEKSFAIKPANVSFGQAAAAGIAALTALQGLRDAGRLQRGGKVLINGASGGIGTFAVQIAKAMGAEVTGVCSARNAELVRSIGADHVSDYEHEEFTKGPARYDVILDIVAAHSWRARTGVLAPTGRYVFCGGPPMRGIGMFFLSPFVGRKLVSFIAKRNPGDLSVLAAMMERGEVVPVIDRTYSMNEARKAVAYVAAGHTRGKVIVVVARS